jgi:hypothetical protein
MPDIIFLHRQASTSYHMSLLTLKNMKTHGAQYPVRKRLPISRLLQHDLLWPLRNTRLQHLLPDNLWEKIETTICCDDRLTGEREEVVALFLCQHSWYVMGKSHPYCGLWLSLQPSLTAQQSESTTHPRLHSSMMQTVLCVAHCPWLTNVLDPMMLFGYPVLEYHRQGNQSHISITHLTNFFQHFMLAGSLEWSISPPWNVSCTGPLSILIMPASVTATNIHINIHTCACPSIPAIMLGYLYLF